MAANVSLTQSLALVGAKLTTGLQNIRRLAAKAAPHRQQTSPVKPTKAKVVYGAIFFLPSIVNKNLGAYDYCLDTNENLKFTKWPGLPRNRFPPHKTRALLFHHDLRAQRDDLAAMARAIVAGQFIGLADVEALSEVATRLRRSRRLRVCRTCKC